ncbi:MAG: hypothetical protein AABW49_01255 [Nanoarchaeota archaeon]
MKKRNIIKRTSFLTIRNYVLITVILLSLLYLIFLSGLIKKNCGDDINCFNSKAYSCKAAAVKTAINNNLYKFVIFGPSGDRCVIRSTMLSVANGISQETVEKLEGRSMICNVPKNLLKKEPITEMQNLISYCSGDLKEGLYEVLLDKMYTLIVQNLGTIIANINTEALNADL